MGQIFKNFFLTGVYSLTALGACSLAFVFVLSFLSPAISEEPKKPPAQQKEKITFKKVFGDIIKNLKTIAGEKFSSQDKPSQNPAEEPPPAPREVDIPSEDLKSFEGAGGNPPPPDSEEAEREAGGLSPESSGPSLKPAGQPLDPSGLSSEQPAGGPSPDPSGLSPESAGPSSEPAGPPPEPSGPSPDPSGLSSEPSGPSSEPSGPSSELSGLSSDPSGLSSEPSGPSPEPSGSSSEPSGSSSEPAGSALDRPPDEGPIDEKGAESSEVTLEIKSYMAPFIYESIRKKDPFEDPTVQKRQGVVIIPKTPPEKYTLKEIRLKGIIWDTKNPKALFKLPSDAGYYTLIKGDKLGKRGVIVDIRESEVVIVETNDVEIDGKAKKEFVTKIKRIDRIGLSGK